MVTMNDADDGNDATFPVVTKMMIVMMMAAHDDQGENDDSVDENDDAHDAQDENDDAYDAHDARDENDDDHDAHDVQDKSDDIDEIMLIIMTHLAVVLIKQHAPPYCLTTYLLCSSCDQSGWLNE